MTDNGRKSASEILEIEGDAVAFDFDSACTFRLLQFKNERSAKQMKTYFETLRFMFTGKKPEEEMEDEVEEM